MSNIEFRAAKIRAAVKTGNPASAPPPAAPTASGFSRRNWLALTLAIVIGGGGLIVIEKPSIHVDIGQMFDDLIHIEVHNSPSAPNAPRCDIDDLSLDRFNENKCAQGVWLPRNFVAKDAS